MILNIYIQSSLNNSNTDGSFIMANSNVFFESLLPILSIAEDTKYLENFSYLIMTVFYVHSFESPLRSNSNEDTQHTINV